ncbi:MAG TPA: CARDB domain-containing protein [Thermoanaerobaculia bacterium]|nr:CARDB domain-containing protein [Thermoanaerobaculia bacterium]
MDRTPSYRSFTVGIALALVLPASLVLAIQPPQGDPVAARAHGVADLYIANAHQPLSRLSAAVAARLQAQLDTLGVPSNLAFYDLRAGRWGTLMTTKPLVPGGGVGNSLTWAALGGSTPVGDEGYKAAVWRAFKAWLDANRAILGIDTTQLAAPSLGSYENGRLVHIHADRAINGVPVRSSFVTGALNNGNLVLYGTQNWGSIDVATTPAVSSESARAAVASHLSGFTITTWGRPELVLVPLASGDASAANEGRGLRYRLAWAVGPQVQGSLGSWEGLVDAQSGELLAFYDRNQYLDQKKVVGGIFPVSNDGQSPGGIPDGVEQPGFPMSRAFVIDSLGNELEANSEGLVEVGGQYSTELTGPFLRIVDNCGNIDESTTCPALDLATSGGTDCAVPAGHSAGDTHSARTGFYEVNRLIDQAKTWLGAGSASNLWVNRQLPANMNINNSCNAFFSPADTGSPSTGSINFYREVSGSPNSGVCRNTGEIAAVFDHEWGHGLDTFDDSPGVSLPGEAYADMTAINRLNTSCIGRGFFKNGFCGGNGDPCTECTGVREADWKKRQSGRPHDLSWVLGQNPTVPGSCGNPVVPPTPFNSGPCQRSTHCEGSIITEAMWDLLKRDLPCHTKRWESFAGGTVGGGRCSGGQSTFMDERSALVLGTRLFYLAAGGVTMGYQCDTAVGGCVSGSWYLRMLAADDDDGTIANGTPHMVAINDAFIRHGIGCGVPLAMNLGCVATPAPTAAPTVTATAGVRSATIQWSNVPDAAEYWILRTDGVHGCNFGKTRVARFAGNGPRTFTQDSLLDGLTYYYSVVAVGGLGNVPADSCAGPMSDCAAVTPLAPNTASAAGAAIEQTDGDPVIESGDGDEFVDNCEKAQLTFNVINTGGLPLTGVRVTAIQPSESETQILTPLPITLASIPAGCGTPAATVPVAFRFQAGGASPQSSLSFQVTIMANELPAPVTATLTIDKVETDLASGSLTFDFESGTQGWEVVSGTFNRTNTPPPGGDGTVFYMKSSSATDDACDRARSPRVRLTATSTLSLFNQFATEAETPATPFYDRANVGIIDELGQRVIVSPDGGRQYNALNSYTGCNNGSGWATDIPGAPSNPFASSSWSATALGAAGYAGQEVQIEVTYGTDALTSLDGFQFDQVRLTNVLLEVADAQSDVCAPPALPDLVVSNIKTSNNKAREGDKVTITATVKNDGDAATGPVTIVTRFLLDNTTILGSPATSVNLAPTGTFEVSVQWDTRSVKGQHVIDVTADVGNVVTESNEGNNTSRLTVDVQGNKVKNGSFEEPNSAANGPDGWSGESTGAGNASWSEGGSDGSKSAATSGNGGNAATSGAPSWTSDPITVVPGEVLTLVVSVQSLGASSAASAGLVYLGAAGQVVNSVTLLTAPLTTTGFAKLEQLVTIPAGVTQVRVKLVGFSPADLRTSGTVRFDEVGLFAN